MHLLHTLLVAGAIVAVLTWLSLCAYVIVVQRRRVDTEDRLACTIATLASEDSRPLPVEARVERMRPLLSGASRELVMRAAAARDTPDGAFDPLLAYLTERWGIDTLIATARDLHRSSRDQWRRRTALRILFRANHPQAMELLARAVGEDDENIAALAFALLGTSSNPRAVDILFDALKAQRHPASRVAVHLDQTPVPIGDRLKRQLSDADPVMRLWCATLLARYPDQDVEHELAALTGDDDPRVRKAAIQTLGKIGDVLAADRARHLLADPFAYVRAHAARALGELGRSDFADDVAQLLGDSDWWVRLAARQALEMMGTDVWPVLMRNLNHTDRFVRNGAAEVIQNLGVLDSLIVMEAATDTPGEAKIEMLRRIAAAGGVRFTDSLVERAGPRIGARIRQLLATIGLEHVGAH